mmetsp:Transcript_6044/g.17659  ORF Transcript_6044/g.17659 Transcript_6044/m.17659 type:complete len:233 (-) Transcript_6044:380-1078(-)
MFVVRRRRHRRPRRGRALGKGAASFGVECRRAPGRSGGRRRTRWRAHLRRALNVHRCPARQRHHRTGVLHRVVLIRSTVRRHGGRSAREMRRMEMMERSRLAALERRLRMSLIMIVAVMGGRCGVFWKGSLGRNRSGHVRSHRRRRRRRCSKVPVAALRRRGMHPKFRGAHRLGSGVGHPTRSVAAVGRWGLRTGTVSRIPLRRRTNQARGGVLSSRMMGLVMRIAVGKRVG